MKTTRYLYDIEPSLLKNMNYEEAIKYKIIKAKELVKELIDQDYKLRDDYRINSIFNAINFNEKLLKELVSED